MSSRPPHSREPATSSTHTRSLQHQIHRRPSGRNADAERPLPPLPATSLPTSYEIPTLRQKRQPGTSNGTPVKHVRSVSHPFPSLFGVKRPDKKKPEDDFDSSDGGTPARADGSRLPSGSSGRIIARGQSERQPQTGKCITCDSTVRWPQEVKVFRCTTCLTINDLEPFIESRTGETSAAQAPPRKPMAISLDRTKKIVDHCLNEYFETLLQLGPGSVRSKFAITEDLNPAIPFATAVKDHPTAETYKTSKIASDTWPSEGAADSHTSHGWTGDASQHFPPNSQGRPHGSRNNSRYASGAEGQIGGASAIFRSLESYVVGCLTGCTALNISFFSVQPPNNSHDQNPYVPAIKELRSHSASTPRLETDSFLSELDAKTLLLGDVVENGSWWTGGRDVQRALTEQARERSPERWHGVTNAKTPRISWPELAEWYQVLVRAGHDWQRRWTNLKPSIPGPEQDKWSSISLGRIQYEIGEAQIHLQRSFLKSTENLLKRPRRPLKNAEDCRFLLMLLANPLLHSPSQHLPGFEQSPISVDDSTSNPQQSGNTRNLAPVRTRSASRRAGALGQHSGIIKRIFGLIANLSNDMHQILVSWMARFSDSHFQTLVDMTSSFVTYRLSKQQTRTVKDVVNPSDHLVPSFSDSGIRHASELHAALEIRPSASSKKRGQDGKPKLGLYSDDWQVRSAARVMSLLFQANTGHMLRKRDLSVPRDERFRSAGLNAKYQAYRHGQIVPISTFYNSLLDHADLVADFEAWETSKTKFTFCQYPFFLSIWAKIHILEHDARRQMEIRAREAFFDSILSRKAVSQYLVLKVRRDCLVEDSLRNVSEVVGSGSDDIKKGLRIDFVGEEGIDAGGLRKEWFLSLVREIFDPRHGMFTYDDDSQYCYFNPYCLESSEKFFLVGVLLGLAIYNSTILDVPFPPFVFKKLLASAPTSLDKPTSMPRVTASYTLEDLAEFRPALAKGLRHLLEYDGDVQGTFCRDFVVDTDRYGETAQIPLCTNGHKRAVTNSNRREFVDLYVRYLLDTAVVRQYEPFKRGFFTVCGGNALSLFRPEEIELLIRGSDEPLDVASLRAVASYENWPKTAGPPEEQNQVVWFWECFEDATAMDQRKLLGFVTGSDRIPAMGATNLNIKLQLLRDEEAEVFGHESKRYPIARTCFNTLGLYKYRSKGMLAHKLWTAVHESEGFGLK